VESAPVGSAEATFVGRPPGCRSGKPWTSASARWRARTPACLFEQRKTKLGYKITLKRKLFYPTIMFSVHIASFIMFIMTERM